MTSLHPAITKTLNARDSRVLQPLFAVRLLTRRWCAASARASESHPRRPLGARAFVAPCRPPTSTRGAGKQTFTRLSSESPPDRWSHEWGLRSIHESRQSCWVIDSSGGLLTTAMLLIVVGVMLLGFAVRGVR